MFLVEFQFEIDQRVKTIFGDVGIVKMMALDDAKCRKVFVQRSQESNWFKESELLPAEDFRWDDTTGRWESVLDERPRAEHMV